MWCPVFIRRTDGWNLRRVGFAAVSLLHIGAVTALGPADAILDAEGARTPIHVESPDNADCAACHGHFFCQLVRSLSLAPVPQHIQIAGLPIPPVRHAEPRRQAERFYGPRLMAGSAVPRAPPTL